MVDKHTPRSVAPFLIDREALPEAYGELRQPKEMLDCGTAEVQDTIMKHA